MKAKELKKKYFKFFIEKKHKLISSASLIPEHDPTVLFTTAGMHPLVPYIMGEPHPEGKRIVNVQKCIRTGDIDEVGDAGHLTFFEMLGNWSLGDYWKNEAIEWSLEFLTSKRWLGLDKSKIYITVFAGDKDAPRDEESAKIWLSLGIPKERIFYYPKEENWWGPAGSIGPCGPDSEIFMDTGIEKCGKNCKPGCGCGKYFELWNDVFIQYNKTKEGKFVPLKQKTVDTGMGVERTAAMLQGRKNVYETETFVPLIEKIKNMIKRKYPDEKQEERSIRIIADHMRAATFILGDERDIVPSNLDQGYVLRKLIRRSIRHLGLLGVNLLDMDATVEIAQVVIDMYKKDYPLLEKKKDFVRKEFKKEEDKFQKALAKGLYEIRKKMMVIAEKLYKKENPNRTVPKEDILREWFGKTHRSIELIPKWVFYLYQSQGFPIEMSFEEIKDAYNKSINNKSELEKEFNKLLKKHQKLSSKGAQKRFKGGLADSSKESKRLHTATHLLNEALRVVLNRNVVQKGSNITKERLRFDFNFDRKLTPEEIKKVEDLVNKKIKESLPVKREEITLEEAKKRKAQGVFEHKYDKKVSVYLIGNFSLEICGGPHVKNTKELGKFKITKEESSAQGIRRIKAVLD